MYIICIHHYEALICVFKLPQGIKKSVVEWLSVDLQNEFSGIKGFSSASLLRIGNLYFEYGVNEKLASPVRDIGWSNNVMLLKNANMKMNGCLPDLYTYYYIVK